MLVLARQRDQSVIIDRRVEVKVVDIRGDKVRLGFVAPPEVEVDRKEVFEQKQLKPAQEKIPEINAGIYAFAVKPLLANFGRLQTDNPHKEYYLTDMAAILNTSGKKVMAFKTPHAHEVAGANTRSGSSKSATGVTRARGSAVVPAMRWSCPCETRR